MAGTAGFAFSVDVQSKETKAALAAQKDKMTKRTVVKATTKSLKPMLAAARSNVPSRTGFSRKALTTRVKSFKNGSTVGLVGAQKGFSLILQKGEKEGVAVTKRGGRKAVSLTLRKFKSKKVLSSGFRNKGFSISDAGSGEIIHRPSRILHLIERDTGFLKKSFTSSAGQVLSVFAAEVKQGVEGGS